MMRKHGFLIPVRNYKFDKERLWRFDFCWPTRFKIVPDVKGGTRRKVPVKVALEIEGRGRHQTVSGYAKDCQKYNQAAIQGWLVVRVPTSALSNEEWLVDVFDALRVRGGIE
jgi:hypothetical protein